MDSIAASRADYGPPVVQSDPESHTILSSSNIAQMESDDENLSRTIDVSSALALAAPPDLSKPFEHPAMYREEVESPTEKGSQDPPEPISESRMIPWRPSFLRVAPLMGIAALTFTVLQAVASYAVLAASNGAEVKNWKYQPTVYLAILTAISNKALAFAAVQGTVVTFWLRALRGTTLGQIQRDWSYGLYVWRAIVSGRHCSLLALACVCATLVAMDGPLLQRASSVRVVVPNSPVTLSVSVSPEIPSYSTGYAYYPLKTKNTCFSSFKTDSFQS